ncbi:U-box domain-containing protein [Drosera capensis]
MDSPHTSSSSSSPNSPSHLTVPQALEFIQSHDVNLRLRAAQEIRRLTKTSLLCRRQLSGSIPCLVDILVGDDEDEEAREAALLALLNLAVKDEKNKVSVVAAGAVKPIIGFLQVDNGSLQEHAAASLLTLSASSVNKPIIGVSGAIPLLVNILEQGSSQAKVDAIMALYNLSTHRENVILILNSKPVLFIVNLLKTCRKSSKTAEKCVAVLEYVVVFDEARDALVSEEGGVLSVVEVLESGSLQSREHAVGILLTMCEVDRFKYRGPILSEGVIPGLLQLTVQGTPKSRSKAKMLLHLLRDSSRQRASLQPADTSENLVYNIISQFNGDGQVSKAEKMLAEMVQASMQRSLRHLQERALVCIIADHQAPDEVPSK